jgi:hypothetical protein
MNARTGLLVKLRSGRGCEGQDNVQAPPTAPLASHPPPASQSATQVMTRDEYERHLRRLEEQLRVGTELLQASYQHQVGAVELIWKMTNGEGVPVPSLPTGVSSQEGIRPPAAPARRSRRGAWALYRDILEALPRIPEVFNSSHLRQALGYDPHRGSLHRTLQELTDDGFITLETLGSGKTPTSYKKTGLEPED